MKIVVLLVLLVSMVAAFTPCCAFDGCGDELGTASSQQDEKDNSGACSPFSSCTTCSGAVVISRVIQIEHTVFVKNSHSATEPSFILPSYYSSFWQPPRVS